MLCCCLAFLHSQTISGTITDKNEKSAPFATILVKDKKIAVSADGEGRFYISNTSSSNVLIISAVGYLSKEIVLGNANSINITLTPKNSNQLGKGVVTALGIKRQPKEIGYSTARIKADELIQAKITDIGIGLTIRQQKRLHFTFDISIVLAISEKLFRLW